MALKGLLSSSPPIQKLLFAIGIMLFSSVVFTIISFILIKFSFGINIFSDMAAFNDLDNPAVLKSMKLLQVLSGGFGLFIVPAFVSAYFFDKNFFEFLSLKKNSALLSFFLVLIISFSSIPVINWLVDFNSRLSLPAALSSLEQWMKNSEEEAARITEAFLKVNSTEGLLLNLFIIALLPAMGEELFFRGIIQKIFSQMTKNSHFAIIITSIIFSAIHLQFYGFLPRMMLGIFLGYLLVWSGSLWLPIVAHFINNAGAVILNYLLQKNNIGFNPDTVGTNSNEKIMLITSVAITFFLIYLVFKNEKRKKEIVL